MKIPLFLTILLLVCYAAMGQQLITGKVNDSTSNLPIIGASISFKQSVNTARTDLKGSFKISYTKPDTLIIRYVGYVPIKIFINQPLAETYDFRLVPIESTLKEVTVSTGYQTVNKERATGSFDQINNQLYSREVSTDIISRLDGIASGLLFDKRQGANNSFSVRGLSTITSSISQPLIVVDNFPYEGNINDINPNDVENVTVLKDAAAASIWGVQAGNGVVVITTKKGLYNQPLKISLSSNYTNTDKPSLYYSPVMSSSDFINVEEYLFNQGFYNNTIANTFTYPVLSPVVSLLNQAKNGTISTAQATSQIDALRNIDVRKDFDKYVYRRGQNQQHYLNVSGGSLDANFNFSAGYDKNLQNLVGNDYDRLTFRNTNQFKPIKNLQIQTTLQYVQTNTTLNSSGGYGAINAGISGQQLYPYAQLADANGNPLPIARDYRTSFTDTAGHGKLLDWKYRPLQETAIANNTSKVNDLLINAGATYKILPGLSAELRYQYEDSQTTGLNDNSINSYFTRNQINLFTQVAGNTFSSIIPYGDILDQNISKLENNDLRGQFNYNKDFGKNNINAIAGGEISSTTINSNGTRTYGYNSQLQTSAATDLINRYKTYDNLQGTEAVQYQNSFGGITNRSVSAFANAAYTYDNRYTLSVSGRRDASNLFGVETNNKWVPLWSGGAAWNISNEKFYHFDPLPYLKLRTTFGYSGNVNNTIAAVTTVTYKTPNSVNSISGLPFAQIGNYPNPNLTWEKVGMLNFALDFATANHRIYGSLEYFYKNATNLVGLVQADLTAGAGLFLNENSADLHNHGVDLTINSVNFTGVFKWNTSLLFSTSKNTVSQYLYNSTSYGQYVGSGALISPIVGQPAYNIVSYKWAGLDPANGNPRAYLNGQVSENYSAIISSPAKSDLVFSGSALPQVYGSLRNDFSYHNLQLSVNIAYRFDYYFRRNALSYSALFNSWVGYGEYDQRWQKPGDELVTNVPSMVYPADGNRDAVYANSSATVEKGDNIRLQDIRLSYQFDRAFFTAMPIKSIQLFGYASNLGILWRANKLHLDPDIGQGLPIARSYSIGCNINF